MHAFSNLRIQHSRDTFVVTTVNLPFFTYSTDCRRLCLIIIKRSFLLPELVRLYVYNYIYL
jgi:hypothetical protein